MSDFDNLAIMFEMIEQCGRCRVEEAAAPAVALLAQFLTYLEEQGEDHLTTKTALTWGMLPAGADRSWMSARLSVVRRFATHRRGIESATEVPPCDPLQGRSCRATPYLYSQEDVIALMTATAALRTPHREATYRTLSGLLAVTGMRVGEAIGLDRDDFDAVGGGLTIRRAKSAKSRELAYIRALLRPLGNYLRRRDRPRRPPNTPALFVSPAGTRLVNVQNTFQKLVCRVGIAPRSAGCRPQLHDLRHAFAVRTLLDAYRDGGDPGRRLALLSTFLGHVDPARRTGISRRHRNCCNWPVIVWNDGSEAAHDRPQRDFAGVLHRPPDPAAASQPAYARRLSGHPAADAGLRRRAA
ncbi:MULTISPECIES: tyrosine-type recombinase/integrase [Mesorhizobium]|uniref:tyrosine-type recombinase/integrase n=1 Tax=Mesorhizobium TaxID=68287 RepID=UPI0024782903|nr:MULTISPECIES: tyrosine-type recombinase/integrase [Mesorhizobium]